MIICPRCGYQTPDGSPWCPRCGYGCPYPMPPQQLQQPPQMPVPYQPQQIPARYDIVDMPPVQEPPKQETPKKGKKKKKCSIWKTFLIWVLSLLGIAIGLIVLLFILVPDSDENKQENTATPSMETLIAKMMDQAGTETAIAILSATPTEIPTETPLPTNTPTPTGTPVPIVITPVYTEQQTYSDNSYAQTGSGVRGSVAQDQSNAFACNIKAKAGGDIYHCKNSPNYDSMWEDLVWFCSPEEAEAAGYRPAKTMYGRCQQ